MMTLHWSRNAQIQLSGVPLHCRTWSCNPAYSYCILHQLEQTLWCTFPGFKNGAEGLAIFLLDLLRSIVCFIIWARTFWIDFCAECIECIWRSELLICVDFCALIFVALYQYGDRTTVIFTCEEGVYIGHPISWTRSVVCSGWNFV